MLLDLEYLIARYHLEIRGIIHIGAHYGEEYALYNALGIPNLVFIEPLAANFAVLTQRVPAALCIRTAVGSRTGRIRMHVEEANHGQSSSILEPDLHLSQYPEITFDRQEEVDLTTIDSFGFDGFNCINVDVQGYELEVFKGAADTLKGIDYILTEVNRASVYKGCALVEDLDAFLRTFGFSRLETTWAGGTWGDAFYSKTTTPPRFGSAGLYRIRRLGRRLARRFRRA